MARVIHERPRRYYGDVARYCDRRARLCADYNIKWFWMSATMRFNHLKKGDAARVIRFKDKPWRFPIFKY